MNCTTCGTPMNDGAQFCPNCGAPAAGAMPVTQAQPTQQYAQPNQQYGQQYQQPNQQYGQQYGQQYQQPNQQYAQPNQQAWPPQPANSRAFAMSMYWGFFTWLFALIVCDKSDPFIRHHLNNVTVMVIAGFICGLLAFIIVGLIGLVFLFVVTIMGTVSAYHGDMKPLPLISKFNIIK